LKKLTESYIVYKQRIKKTLGTEKMPVREVEGMKKTLESFQDRKRIQQMQRMTTAIKIRSICFNYCLRQADVP
jgi:hypothetical protein